MLKSCLRSVIIMSNRRSYDINIFFDESGKSTEKIHLMGAISIPKSYYKLHIKNLDRIIKLINLHWTNYG